MLTLTTQYAFRALVRLSKHDAQETLPAKTIAADMEVSWKYLSRILAALVRAGILQASRGRNGGFRLARPPEDILLAEVVELFEPVLGNRRPCPFGNFTCNDESPCTGHHPWKHVRDSLAQFLNRATLSDVADGERGEVGAGEDLVSARDVDGHPTDRCSRD